MITLEPKDPSEAKRYEFDLESWLDAMETTISSLTSVTGSGVTVTGTAFSTKQIQALLSGGTAGTVAKVEALFTTADGQTLIATIQVPIEEK